uniref:Uncharacterized protein n=1 Tax=Anguilla anguilla TaxID=7936 RepID=A0A0E9SAU5_ANGAN
MGMNYTCACHSSEAKNAEDEI